MSSVLARIRDLFEAEGFREVDIEPRFTGERRCLVERYSADVDWTRQDQCNAVLRVSEAVLDDLDATARMTDAGDRVHAARTYQEHLLELLARDGIHRA